MNLLLTLTLSFLKKKIGYSKKKNNKIPKVLVVVHMAGSPADMFQIKKLSKKYNFKIIEDASHAIELGIMRVLMWVPVNGQILQYLAYIL